MPTSIIPTKAVVVVRQDLPTDVRRTPRGYARDRADFALRRLLRYRNEVTAKRRASESTRWILEIRYGKRPGFPVGTFNFIHTNITAALLSSAGQRAEHPDWRRSGNRSLRLRIQNRIHGLAPLSGPSAIAWDPQNDVPFLLWRKPRRRLLVRHWMPDLWWRSRRAGGVLVRVLGAAAPRAGRDTCQR